MSQQFVVHEARHAAIVDSKHFESRLHAIKRGGLPHKVHRKVERQVSGAFAIAQLHRNLLVRQTHHVTHRLPRIVGRVASVTQHQFVARHQAQLSSGLVERKTGHLALVETSFPANAYTGTRLRFLGLLIVIGLHFHQRSENVLIDVCIVIAQLHALRLVVHAWLLQIIQRSFGSGLPHFFQLVDLLTGNLARALHLVVRRNFDQPGQEAAVLHQRHPRVDVPRHIFESSRAGARIAAQQDHPRSRSEPE